jgi:arginine/lysine/ornithine decarboxylase
VMRLKPRGIPVIVPGELVRSRARRLSA